MEILGGAQGEFVADSDAGVVYFTEGASFLSDAGSIQSWDPDAGLVRVTRVLPFTPTELAMDATGFYVADEQQQEVWRISKERNRPVADPREFVNPSDLCVAGGEVFWTNGTDVNWAPADGGVVTLLSESAGSLTAYGDSAYWVDASGLVRYDVPSGTSTVMKAGVGCSVLFCERRLGLLRDLRACECQPEHPPHSNRRQLSQASRDDQRRRVQRSRDRR